MHIRNLTCTVSRKHQTSGTQLHLEQADGQYSRRCSVFINMALLRWFCGLVHQKVSFIILLLRLGLVGLRLVGSLEFNVPFQHKYIRDEGLGLSLVLVTGLE